MATDHFLHLEIGLQCICGYRFRARVDAQTTPEPTQRYEVYCPQNGSLLFFPAANLRRVATPDHNLPVAHREGSRYTFFREQRDSLFATDQDWQTGNDLDKMLAFLWRRLSIRKLRLIACAFCRRVWSAMTDERSRRAIAAAESLADGLADMNAVPRTEIEAQRAWDDAISDGRRCHAAAAAWVTLAADDWNAEWDIGEGPTKAVSWAATNARWVEGGGELEQREKVAQAEILRDVTGPIPLRSIAVSPTWLTINVVALAQAIYEERAFDRLPILADALEDAGCTKAEILNHCRQSGVHVRGCWVIDLLLGKE